jgi:hypothetical protein
MNAPATTSSVDTAAMISRARAILAGDRPMTGDEEKQAHDDLYRCMEAQEGRALGELRYLYSEVERVGRHRAAEARVAAAQALQRKADEFEERRPERWAALSPMKRAALLLTEELNDSAAARAIARFVEFVEDPKAAERDPPLSFERRAW